MRFKLAADGKSYEGEESTTPTTLPGIGLPFNIGFWAEPGQEANLIKVAVGLRGGNESPQAAAGVRSGQGRGSAAPADDGALIERLHRGSLYTRSQRCAARIATRSIGARGFRSSRRSPRPRSSAPVRRAPAWAAIHRRRSDDRRHPERDQERRDHLQRRRAGVHRPRQGLQRRLCGARDRRRQTDSRAATGTTRAGSPLLFPTKTVAASSLIPNLDQYAGPPLEFGRMEATASDPSVQQQYGMVAGIPNAGQLNAFETLNIRGERSVTCKGEFDAPPGTPLPAGAPGRLRRVPQATRCAGARRRARRAVRQESRISRRCRCTASRSRSRTGTT